MKIIEVKNMFECPFLYTEVYRMSEQTGGADDMCTITEDYCFLVKCPLAKEKTIKVIWRHKRETV